jgi:hypothetical protein
LVLVLGLTTELEPLSSLLDEVVDSDEPDDETVELVLVLEVVPQRISVASPVIPRLTMLIVAVRLVATRLPFSLMSTVWSRPFVP